MTRSLAIPSRWSPTLIDDFRREMNRMVEGLWEDEPQGTTFFSPRTNFAETDEAYEISVDLPGMNADDFEIEFKEGRLWITGERTQEAEDQGKKYHRVERSHGKFRRVVVLGDDVDGDQIEAKYHNGVLAITLGKLAQVQPKRIKVKS